MKQMIILQVSLLAAFLLQEAAAQKVKFADNFSSKKITGGAMPIAAPTLKGKGGGLLKKADKKSGSAGKCVEGGFATAFLWMQYTAALWRNGYGQLYAF
jgi:hypothetical protein